MSNKNKQLLGWDVNKNGGLETRGFDGLDRIEYPKPQGDSQGSEINKK